MRTLLTNARVRNAQAKKAALKNKLWRGVQSTRMMVLGKLLTGDPKFLDYARSDKLWGKDEFNVN